MIRQLMFAVALATGLVAQPSVAAHGVRNVVLVHGAWADGSSWSKRATTCSMVKPRNLAAASSSAKGMPSRRRHTCATAAAFSGVMRKPGTAATARAAKSCAAS